MRDHPNLKVVNPDAPPGLFAIDPGGTTGTALWTPDDGIYLSEQEGRYTMYAFMDLVAGTGRPWTIILERFTITSRTAENTPQPDALWITGAVDRMAWKLGWPCTTQLPVEAMRFANDAKLRAAGWFRPTKGGHQNDAARHLLLWFSKNRGHSFTEGLLDEVAKNLDI